MVDVSNTLLPPNPLSDNWVFKQRESLAIQDFQHRCLRRVNLPSIAKRLAMEEVKGEEYVRETHCPTWLVEPKNQIRDLGIDTPEAPPLCWRDWARFAQFLPNSMPRAYTLGQEDLPNPTALIMDVSKTALWFYSSLLLYHRRSWYKHCYQFEKSRRRFAGASKHLIEPLCGWLFMPLKGVAM